MTRFWLVRHGPTHAKAMIGWTELPADLSDTAALDRLSAHLPTEAPVISSDLIRATTTADRLGRRRLPHDPGLREIHFGQWERRRFDEVNAETPDLLRAFWEKPGLSRPPGGESWNELSQRSLAALARLQGLADDIIVVAHFGPILCALQSALGRSTEEIFAQKIEPLSVTSLSLSPGQAFEINHHP